MPTDDPVDRLIPSPLSVFEAPRAVPFSRRRRGTSVPPAAERSAPSAVALPRVRARGQLRDWLVVPVPPHACAPRPGGAAQQPLPRHAPLPRVGAAWQPPRRACALTVPRGRVLLPPLYAAPLRAPSPPGGPSLPRRRAWRPRLPLCGERPLPALGLLAGPSLQPRALRLRLPLCGERFPRALAVRVGPSLSRRPVCRPL